MGFVKETRSEEDKGAAEIKSRRRIESGPEGATTLEESETAGDESSIISDEGRSGRISCESRGTRLEEAESAVVVEETGVETKEHDSEGEST